MAGSSIGALVASFQTTASRPGGVVDRVPGPLMRFGKARGQTFNVASACPFEVHDNSTVLTGHEFAPGAPSFQRVEP